MIVTKYLKLIISLGITMGFRNTTFCLEKLNLTFSSKLESCTLLNIILT